LVHIPEKATQVCVISTLLLERIVYIAGRATCLRRLGIGPRPNKPRRALFLRCLGAGIRPAWRERADHPIPRQSRVRRRFFPGGAAFLWGLGEKRRQPCQALW